MSLQPKNKPRLPEDEFLEIVNHYDVDREKYPVVLVGIRGYYLDSMGKEGVNDRKVYDDCVAWLTPNGCMTYNFNVDPNGYRKGSGFGSKKGMANLKTGLWHYKKGLHKGYSAFRQADVVTVLRDGLTGSYENTGWFGINIHKGGRWSTSSLGCQTLPRTQWDSFKKLGYAELSANKQKVFPYILIDELERRKL